MVLSPTAAAHLLYIAFSALPLCALLFCPSPWCFAAGLLLIATALYAQAALHTRRVQLTQRGLRVSGGIFRKEILRIPFGKWTGLRVLLFPGIRAVFLLLPHRSVYLFPMTAAQLNALQKYMEHTHEA